MTDISTTSGSSTEARSLVSLSESEVNEDVDLDSQTPSIEKIIKAVGEVAFTPGTSLLLDGNIKSGAVHAGAGFIAKRLLGLPGLLLVGANSYSRSVTGKSLLGHLQGTSSMPITAEPEMVKRIREEINNGRPMKEIIATVVEDAEDAYHEISSAIKASKT